MDVFVWFHFELLNNSDNKILFVKSLYISSSDFFYFCYHLQCFLCNNLLYKFYIVIIIITFWIIFLFLSVLQSFLLKKTLMLCSLCY
jgi:hypothetical protein